MAPDRPLTDRLASARDTEFRWDTSGPSEIHALVGAPIVASLHRARAHDVLDLGCGNGWFTAALARCGFDVVGVDQSESGIAIARQAHPGLCFERCDLTAHLGTSLVGRFDAVVSVEVIEHLLLPRRLIENALGALRPGGQLVVTTPFHGYLKNLALALGGRLDAHWHPLRDFGHVKFFSRATLTALFLEYGFTDLRFRTVGRIPPLARSMVVTGRAPR